jgi:hypothetical protein
MREISEYPACSFKTMKAFVVHGAQVMNLLGALQLRLSKANDDIDIEDKSRRYDKKKQVRVDERHYLITSTPKTLKQIDKPRPTLYHNLVAHPSELGWARPDRHRLHFNKFPQEIKDSIFSFVLTVPGKVSPCTVRSNWKTNYCQPHYEVFDQPKFSEISYYASIVWIVSEKGKCHNLNVF